MGLFRRKKKPSPEVETAVKEITLLLRRYSKYAFGEDKDEDSIQYKAYWAIVTSLQSGHNEVIDRFGRNRVEVMSARQSWALDLLLKEGNEDVRTEILMTDLSAV
ncbi:hypothetical protein C4544_04190 [candidate division WS5 bacterium]|uniref:Uncharacterized protein n=1 Tax=candidate division WS5 bacterium TaxID=2093353 RepID=A0A419DD26_9BACT|nr:MAG: hypothetical protein C4544_04190 [candidate division WS5 bacterium]